MHSLLDLSAIDRETGDVNVVVETPKGSRIKYKYDAEAGTLRLRTVLGAGLAFPHDFGFVPSTLGEGGDPLDVVLLVEQSLAPCTVVPARLIGVLEVRQREGRGDWTRNDRFFAVANASHAHRDLQKLADLGARRLSEIAAFFVHYTALEGKKLEVLSRRGPSHAGRLLRAGSAACERNRRS